ncbi:MAG TPA: hypothetical protein VHD91_05660 [Gaiellaceae bacterium]|nr:hypothetical protein [Gaiellaceae bacterium]
MVRARRLVLAAAVVLACAACGSGAGSDTTSTQPHAAKRPFLWQCTNIGLDEARDECYERLLLQTIDASHDPADELPKIDKLARESDTDLYGRCHMLMHVVGRRWGAEHHLTLEGLQKVVPRSNDPGCSAGFGMGLVIYLGPQIIPSGGKSALKTCVALPTRYRQYTCVHSLGHALMRGYHEALWLAVHACERLGARYAPDCAQGAFHDYWISLTGSDDTTSPVHVVRSARVLCAEPDYRRFAIGCWYRYFIEQLPAPVILNAADLEKTCRGLTGTQREGCIAGASFELGLPMLEQARLCGTLPAADAVPCLRGVTTQGAAKPAQQFTLLRDCTHYPASVRAGCVSWLGLAFQLVTDGRFARSGCPQLATAADRKACLAGTRRANGPIVTFS